MMVLLDRKCCANERCLTIMTDLSPSGWGVGDRVRKTGVELLDVQIRRWQNGEELGRNPVNMKYGNQIVSHRADLHNALVDAANQYANFHLRLSSVAVDVDFKDASVTLANGDIVQGDIVLAADGIKSFVRGKLLSEADNAAVPTGDAVFRVMLSRQEMEKDPILKPFIDKLRAIRWVGPGGHVVAYPLRDGQLYNLVLAHPDRGGLEESWTTVGSKKNLLAEYEGWDPKLIKMLELVPDQDVLEWKLCSHPILPTWVRDKVALLGDACHPML